MGDFAVVKRPVPLRDLFGRVPASKPTAAAVHAKGVGDSDPLVVEPFDAWDESRMVPDPGWTVPAELRIWTDDLSDT